MFTRYSFNPSPRPKTLQDILSEKYASQQAGMPPPNPLGQPTSVSRPPVIPNEPVGPEPNPMDNRIPNDTPEKISPEYSREGLDFGNPTQPNSRFNPIKPDFGSPATSSGFDSGLDKGENYFGDYDPTQAAQSPSEPPQKSILERYNSLRNPKLDELVKLLQNAPDRSDPQYKPNWKDWVFGGMEGAGLAMSGNLPAGLKTIDNIRNSRFDEANQDYEGKVKNATALAGLGDKELEHQVKGLDYESNMLQDIEKNKIERDKLIQQGWIEIKDEINGKTIMYNKSTNERRELRTSLTAAEKNQEAKDLQTQKDTAAMARTQAGQSGANFRTKLTQDREDARAKENNRIARERITADQDKPDVQKNIQKLASIGIKPGDYFTYDPESKIWTLDQKWANKFGDNTISDFERERIIAIKEALNPYKSFDKEK